MRQLRVLGLVGAMILTSGLGIGFILAGVGVLSLTSLWGFLDTVAGLVLINLVGVSMLLISVTFFMALARERLSRSLFHHEGRWGRIDLAPKAVKELIADVLRKEIGLDRFRISLSHDVDGVGIFVRTTLAPNQKVTEVGERIQRELATHVVERTGVEVSDVVVHVHSIRASEAEVKEPTSDATNS